MTYMGGPAGPMMVPALGCYYSGGFCGQVVRDASLCLDDEATRGVLGQDDEWVAAQQAAGGVAGIAGAIQNFIGQIRSTVTGKQPQTGGTNMTPLVVGGGVAVVAIAAYFMLRKR